MSLVDRLFSIFTSNHRELLLSNDEYSVYLDYVYYSTPKKLLVLAYLILFYPLYRLPSFYSGLYGSGSDLLLGFAVLGAPIVLDIGNILTLHRKYPSSLAIQLRTDHPYGSLFEFPELHVNGDLLEPSFRLQPAKFQRYYNYFYTWFKDPEMPPEMLGIDDYSFQLPQLDIQLTKHLLKLPVAIIIEKQDHRLKLLNPDHSRVMSANSYIRQGTAMKILLYVVLPLCVGFIVIVSLLVPSFLVVYFILFVIPLSFIAILYFIPIAFNS